MCGICGAYNKDVRKMVIRLSHRGPDGNGIFDDGETSLGHTRLSILDHNGGKQPMTDGKRTIVFNGEIYNFVELHRELKYCGYTFQTDSDTEVILAAYDKWGEDCLHRFDGMWAFAIWDGKSLFLSRDRLGVKPLYYHDKDGFAFSSEVKGFIDVIDLELDDAELSFSESFQMSAEGSEKTIFHGIKRLLPGHNLTWNNGVVTLKRWFKPYEFLEVSGHKPEKLLELLEISCTRRLRSDVPIATCLSGGLDSSSIFAVSRKLQSDRTSLDRYSAYIAMYGDNEEQELALKLAGKNARTVQVEPEKGILEKLVYCYEDTGKLYPGQYQIYREMAKNGIKVSLDGHGPDETLGGYAISKQYFDGNKFIPPHDASGIWASDSKYLKDKDESFRHLYWMCFCGFFQWILKTYDRASMAHGVESRAPFLMSELFFYMLTWPSSKKIKDGLVKAPLREAMKNILPESIRTWPTKRGFSSPVNKWVKRGIWTFDVKSEQKRILRERFCNNGTTQ